MQTLVNRTSKKSVPLLPFTAKFFSTWIKKQPKGLQNWVKACDFTAKPNSFCLVQDAKGHLGSVLVGVKSFDTPWAFAFLPEQLPAGLYHWDESTKVCALSESQAFQAALQWALATYEFTRYKKSNLTWPRLVMPSNVKGKTVNHTVASVNLVRDLINTPTEDLGPKELSAVAKTLAKDHKATFSEVVGTDLLKKNYPAIHTVGRASSEAPRLLDLKWGNTKHPKLTLVGKGVCFDSGGLDLKPARGMELMKKDMGGSAHVLGLANLIMAEKLPVRLRVLVPAVENAVSGNAYRPGDVIKTRQGLTVEVGNTDAEGRVILADALTEASREKPDLMIDFATLTGAARIAMGTELAALFCNDTKLEKALQKASSQTQDPLWPMPLYQPYRALIDSPIADISNTGSSPYGGAITAALFLQDFVGENIPWAHFDIMAWNSSSKPGRPKGGEAMALRAVFEMLKDRYVHGRTKTHSKSR